MGITSIRAWIVAASLLSISAVSQAAGLGKLTVMSALGEPLKAEVELVAEKNETGSLGVRLATADAFERAGLSYSTLLASVKVSLEKRASGEPYVKITSTQPATEPFVDLLIELTWSSGRISREFTALLDPPEVAAERAKQKAAAAEVKPAPTPAPPVAEPVPAPTPAEPPKTEAPAVTEPAAQAPSTPTPTEAKPEEPKPEQAKAEESKPAEAPAPTPTETIGGTQPTLLGSGSDAAAKADAYGPVKSGDTLNKIATATKPADVSLEQMLVLLVRSNPDAFSGKNMNRLKTGKILQLPTADQFASVNEADARKEVKLQARDWHAYRDQLAAAAGGAAPAEEPAQQATSGKVGAPAQDKAATPGEQPKEVLKLSKNEPPAAGGDAKAAARVRALEEEVVARDKAVKEANERVAILQKQVDDLKNLMKLKSQGMAETQKPAATPPAAAPTPAPPVAATPPKPAVPPPPAPATPPVPEAKPSTPAPASPAPAPVTPKTEGAPAPAQPEPTPPKPATPKPIVPTPAPEPSLMDQVLDQPAILGGAVLGVLIVVAGLAFRAIKRRRESKSDAEESGPARGLPDTAALAPPAAVAAGAASAAEAGSEEVDPIAEAEIFLAYGRDAQAEELLKEALATSSRKNEIQLKLLQIYANRKDAKSFEKVARELQQGTGGSGPIWDQAVILGYQVDPENARYAAGKAAAEAGGVAGAAASGAENVDFNIGGEESSATTTDIDLGDHGAFERTQIIDPAAEPEHDSTVSMEAPAPAMDFNVDLPATDTVDPEPATIASSSGLDFDIDLNSLTSSAPEAASAPAEEPGGGGLDFDMSGLSLDTPGEPKLEASSAPEIDLSGISLDLGTETAPAVSPTGKDDHWYDVQTKFDLAKAYQEMGDKDGAREILKEVLQEGDTEQKAAAQGVLSSLDA